MSNTGIKHTCTGQQHENEGVANGAPWKNQFGLRPQRKNSKSWRWLSESYSGPRRQIFRPTRLAFVSQRDPGKECTVPDVQSNWKRVLYNSSGYQNSLVAITKLHRANTQFHLSSNLVLVIRERNQPRHRRFHSCEYRQAAGFDGRVNGERTKGGGGRG